MTQIGQQVRAGVEVFLVSSMVEEISKPEEEAQMDGAIMDDHHSSKEAEDLLLEDSSTVDGDFNINSHLLHQGTN
jgi:hypothetical protein